MTIFDGREVCKIREVAEMLGVSDRTILRYIQSGKLEAFKIDRVWFVYVDDLRGYTDIKSDPQKYGVTPVPKITKHKMQELRKIIEKNKRRLSKVEPFTVDEIKQAVTMLDGVPEATRNKLEMMLQSYQLQGRTDIEKLLCFYFVGLFRGTNE